MWRTSEDLIDSWEAPGDSATDNGILAVLDQSRDLSRYAGPGGWNDMDMLVVGLNGRSQVGGDGCTATEYRSHMSLWCMLASPLMVGCDIRTMDEATRAILTNVEVISINQDSLAAQGVCVRDRDGIQIYTKPLMDENMAAWI